MKEETIDANQYVNEILSPHQQVLKEYRKSLRAEEIGIVSRVDRGTVSVTGLPNVCLDELIEFSHGSFGLAFNLDRDEVGVILLDQTSELESGDDALRTYRQCDVPVGEELLGRVIDPLGRPKDRRGPLETSLRRPVERPAPPIIDRAPVTVPLQTGLKVVDALIPIGRGQRELILGDRQTGKTSIAIDTIINQKNSNTICIYCAIAQRASAVANVIDRLEKNHAMEYSVVLVAEGDSPPGLQFIAPYAATAIGEYFMEQGRDVLIVYDDLTSHARAYRELSLLLRRPPGREAFPGDIFFVHSRLLERSTHLREELGGGSLTALPIAETEAQNVAAYIPTNLISITDGQVYLSPDLYQKGILPAVDVGKSVSRVGGKTQLPAYRRVAGDLRLYYSQFGELEAFSRFSTRLDEETRRTLNRGRRVREILKQQEGSPFTVAAQIVSLLTVTQGLFDDIELEEIATAESLLVDAVLNQLPEICQRMECGDELNSDDLEALLSTLRRSVSKELATS